VGAKLLKSLGIDWSDPGSYDEATIIWKKHSWWPLVPNHSSVVEDCKLWQTDLTSNYYA